LDKFGRYYSWFLLVATVLPALVRLARPRQFARVTSERITADSRRARHRLWGWVSLLGSAALLPVYLYYSHRRWLLVAFLVGVLTGVEMIRNSASPGADSLTRQNRLFGAAYAVCALLTYFFLIRR